MSKKPEPQQQPEPNPPAPVATGGNTMVAGCTVAIYGFIPIPKNDLRRQIEISQALLDFQTGKTTVADLAKYMKQVEVKTNHVSRRVTTAEAKEWSGQASLSLEQKKSDDDGQQEQDGNDGD